MFKLYSLCLSALETTINCILLEWIIIQNKKCIKQHNYSMLLKNADGFSFISIFCFVSNSFLEIDCGEKAQKKTQQLLLWQFRRRNEH